MSEWLLLQEGGYVYLIIFLLLLGGAFFLPIPEDIPLIAAGIFINRGQADLILMFLVCYGTIIIGDLIVFQIGSWLGPSLFKKQWFIKRVSNNKLRKLRVSIEKRRLLMIFIARHLFYLRTVTFLTCGAVKMHILRFLAADALAASVSATIMLSLGYYAADNYETILKFIKHTEIALIVVALIVVSALYYYSRKKSKDKN